MYNDFKSNRFGSKPRGKSYGGDRDFKKMFSAVCATCNASCEVPFKPNGRKPVLCSNCFGKDGGGTERRFERHDSPRFERNDAPRGGSSISPDQFRTLNEKLDAIIRAIAEM